jgi:hypothetical protein
MSSTIETAHLPDSGRLTPKEKDDNKEINNPDVSAVPVSNTAPKDLRFWLIIFALLISTFLSALDLTGTTFLLFFFFLVEPTLKYVCSIQRSVRPFRPSPKPSVQQISRGSVMLTVSRQQPSLHGNLDTSMPLHIWPLSTPTLCRSGGLANVFGRRPILLGGLLFFAVGSAMCGAASNMR